MVTYVYFTLLIAAFIYGIYYLTEKQGALGENLLAVTVVALILFQFLDLRIAELELDNRVARCESKVASAFWQRD